MTVGTQRPGVTYVREVSLDVYTGTAEALATAGLITVDQLPGQPGRPGGSVTYRHGVQATRRGGRGSRGLGYLRIYKKGHGRFSVEVGITDEERIRRFEEMSQRERENEVLMRAFIDADKSEQQFRREHLNKIDCALMVAWHTIFSKKDSMFWLDIPEGSDGFDRICTGLGMVKKAVLEANVVRNAKAQPIVNMARARVAASADVTLQAMLKDAHKMRLVRSEASK